jgi:SAM-dependent methyltransferase
LCNQACLDFAADAVTAEIVAGARVLEVGSADLNGSVRSLVVGLGPASYLGVDLVAGPGVDEICDAGELAVRFGRGSFDLVVSTEMLEHVRDWRAAVTNLKLMLCVGGWLLVTTRSLGFPFHGYPEDHWRYEVDDMRTIFADFDITLLVPDTPPSYGVFMLARKTSRRPVNLGPVGLYSMTLGRGTGMRQARESGWYSRKDGGETFVPKGQVRPDNHPDVLAIPDLFDSLGDDAPPVEQPAAKRKAPAP